jgi:hypothetical protein
MRGGRPILRRGASSATATHRNAVPRSPNPHVRSAEWSAQRLGFCRGGLIIARVAVGCKPLSGNLVDTLGPDLDLALVASAKDRNCSYSIRAEDSSKLGSVVLALLLSVGTAAPGATKPTM